MTNKEKKEMQQAIEKYRASLENLQKARLEEFQSWQDLKCIVGRDKAQQFEYQFRNELGMYQSCDQADRAIERFKSQSY